LNKLKRDYKNIPIKPTKVLQIGSGVFIRGFFDFALHKLNEKCLADIGVVIATSSSKKDSDINSQDGLYTVIECSTLGHSPTIVDCIKNQISMADNFDEFLMLAHDININVVISNTTEVGIVYEKEDLSSNPKTYPARITLWIKKRYDVLKEKNKLDEDLFVIPCELISNNGDVLKKYIIDHSVNFGFEDEFIAWVQNHVKTYNTLVDRIVPGYPKEYIDEWQKEWDYEDSYAILCEKFMFFALEGDTEKLDKVLPLSKIDLDIVYTDNIDYYYKRKVHYLNGGHTSILGISTILGYITVKEALKDESIYSFLKLYLSSVHKALGDNEEAKIYIDNVLDRFLNPYLSHKWSSILFAAFQKFAIRNIPPMLAMEKSGIDTRHALFSLATLIFIHRKGIHNDANYIVFKSLMDRYPSLEDFVPSLLKEKAFFDMPLPVDKWSRVLIDFIVRLEDCPKKALDSVL